ncbi:unnamed protein product, partial [marine sediment metagenome]
QTRAVVNEVYADLDIPLDSKEYKMTAPDLTNEIMIGGAQLTDMAIKMAFIDKLGVAKVNKFLSYLGENGKLYKFGTGVFKMALEEGKFRVVGGNAGTGAAFYVANKVMPTIHTKKPWLDVIWNGFAKGTFGMTIAMEGAAQMETAYHAAANDNDVIREMTEVFGELPEASRRIMVELITAAPFGIKGMFDRGALPNVSAPKIGELAKEMEANGAKFAAAEMRSLEAQLGSKATFQATWDTMYKIEILKENKKYDRGELKTKA